MWEREVAAGEGLSCPLFPPAVPLAMTAQFAPAPHDAITLGILAGGRATRLGGRDKAWLERAGKPLVLALARRLAPEVVATLVSANRNADLYLSHGLRAIHDRSEEHTSELQSLMRISYDVFCLKKKKRQIHKPY